MNLKHWIIKKLGGVPDDRWYPNELQKNIFNSVFYQTGYSRHPKGTGLTSDNLNKIFKKAIKKLKPTDQLPIINGKQLTQEDLNNWYKRKDEKDKED